MDKTTGNSEENTKKRRGRVENLKPWKPGECGNPNGRPKKKPITEIYEKILENPEHASMIAAAVVKSLKKGQMAMVLQLKEMAERVEGKITQPVEVEVNLTISDRLRKARERRQGS